MRESKFRAWDNVESEMYYTGEEELILFMFDSNGIVADKVIPDDSVDGFHSERLEHLKYMQYTGLKDKNGRDIYEGDVCRNWIGGWLQNSPYVVEDMRELYLELNRDDGYYRIGQIEVIGNIHENPELLGDIK